MPKMKTNRGAAKRLRRTGKGKIKRMRAYKSTSSIRNPQKESAVCGRLHW